MANDRHPPPVIWAQRADKLYLTINLEDCKDPTIKIEEGQLFFKGHGGSENHEFEITMQFFKGVTVADSKYVVLARHIPMVIMKKETGYWPRLMKESTKVHWLKTDFSKWRDEDDSDADEGSDMKLEDMMSQMGNFNAGESAMGAPPEEADSDDDELPDLE